MKRILTTIIVISILAGTVYAQGNNQPDTKIINQKYGEFNFGAALIRGDFDGPFPGLSILIGNKTYFRNNVIFDAQIGFALPSLGTAKFGVGYKTMNGEFIVGIRPWPMHFYLQTQLD